MLAQHLPWYLHYFIEPPLQRPSTFVVVLISVLIVGAGPLVMWILWRFMQINSQPCRTLDDYRERFLARAVLPFFLFVIMVLLGLSIRLII